MAFPALLRCHLWSEPPLCLTAKLASGAGVSTWLRLGDVPGWSWETNQPPMQFSTHPVCPAPGESKCSCSPHEQCPGSPQPSCWSHWPSNQPRKLIFPVADPRAGTPNVWFKPLTPQGGSPHMESPFSSESPPRDTGSDLITSLLFPPDSMCIFLTVLVVQESFCQPPVSFQ